ncbi:MAG: ATP-binding protein [Pseudomonadota bacterium]
MTVRLGIRGRLFLLSLVVFTVVGLASGLVLELSLRRWLEGRIEDTLAQELGASLVACRAAEPWRDAQEADALADALGAAMGARVSLIAADGRVLGDSELDPTQLATLENHGQRPEVVQARVHGQGRARRRSDTLETDMLYLAAPAPGGLGVVRLALPLTEVDRVMGRLRLSLLAVLAVGLGLAAGMSALASELAARTLRRLVRHARSLTGGAAGAESGAQDDLGALASGIGRLGDELAARLADLAEERARFGAVLDGLDAAVLVLDARRRVSLANARTAPFLGVKVEPRQRLLSEICRVPELDGLVRDLPPGGRAELEIPLPERGGRTLLAQAHSLPGSHEVILVIQDITRLRRLEKVRRDFVANVSHELRTPVSVIQANTETLLGGALAEPDEARAFLEAIQRNTERMGRLVSDLLDLSRIEAGQVEVQLEATDLGALVERVLAALRPLASQRETRLASLVQEGTSVRADPRHLEHALTNLLDNAVRYSPPGSTVQVRARQEGPRIRLEVVDDGPGIEPQHLPRIFERFYRVDKGRSRAEGGTGLGLAIVKHLVGLMGGRVGAEAAAPQGSVFWIELPRGTE